MPRMLWLLLVAAIAGMAAGCAPALAAPPRLVAIWPAAGARLPVQPQRFDLTFNHPLRAESTWAAVWREEDGAPLPIDSVVERANPRRLTLHLQNPVRGEYRLRWHAVAARTAATIDGEQDFALQDESTPPPHLDVSRATADTGDRLQLKGTGFGQESRVRLTIGDDDQSLSTTETDAQGSFVAEAKVPPGVAFGVQPVSASDQWGDAATTALQVRWGGWPPLVAFTVGQPGPGPGDVTFSLSVRNRSDYLLERVRIVLDDPTDATYVAAEPSPARKEGTLAWEIPTVDRGVVGPFRATYRVTGAVASHARIEFRHRRPHGCDGDDCSPAFVSETTSDSTPVYPAD